MFMLFSCFFSASFLMWLYCYKNCFNKYNNKIKNNLISASHSILGVVFSGLLLQDIQNVTEKNLYNFAINGTVLENYNYSNDYYVNIVSLHNNYITHDVAIAFLTAFSSSYFLWDILYIFYFDQLTEKPLYIYHHLTMLFLHYFIINSNNQYEYLLVFYYGELSNFFTYIVYHLLKIKHSLVTPFKIIQCVWFLYYRAFILSWVSYHHLLQLQNKYMAFLLIGIYILGLLWGCNLIKDIKNAFS